MGKRLSIDEMLKFVEGETTATLLSNEYKTYLKYSLISYESMSGRKTGVK